MKTSSGKCREAVERLGAGVAVPSAGTWTGHCKGWRRSVPGRTDWGTASTGSGPVCSTPASGPAGTACTVRPVSAVVASS